MSNENAELAYLAVDAFNRRDLDALLELVDPEVEFTRSRRRWGRRLLYGHEGLGAGGRTY
jgi:ketosteroid isomerase-like protein